MSVRIVSYPIQRLAAGAMLVCLLGSPIAAQGTAQPAAQPRRRPTAAASSGSS